MTQHLPFSQACENNKAPILDVIRPLFSGRQVLEIGSGTAQHAIHFAQGIPNVIWQCSDQAENLSGISARLAYASLANTPPALELDVTQPWPEIAFNAVFSANTLHIMSWSVVQQLFEQLQSKLPANAVCAFYGPFNYGGEFTSASNANFDEFLKQRDPAMGIRDFEAVEALAHSANLELLADHEMPANNRLLAWKSRSA